MDYIQYFQNLKNRYHCSLDLYVDLTAERMAQPVKIYRNHLVLDSTRSYDYTSVIDEFFIYSLMNAMVITTEHLVIKNLTVSSLNEYFEMVSDENICYLEASQPIHDQNAALRKLMEVKLSAKGIYLEDHLIGVISYIKDPARAKNGYEVGYSISSKYQNRGLGSEAMKGFVDYLFENSPIQIISARVLEDNPRSSHVLEKIGFSLEGLRKQSLIHPMDQKMRNTYVYSIENKNELTLSY